MSETNYFDVLGVSPEATTEEIKAAFRKLARTFHPDVNSSDGATAKMVELNEAYATLIDEDDREEYRQSILGYRRRDDPEPAVTPDRPPAAARPVQTRPDDSRYRDNYRREQTHVDIQAERFKEQERLRVLGNLLRTKVMQAKGIADILDALHEVQHEPLTAKVLNPLGWESKIGILAIIDRVQALQTAFVANNRVMKISALGLIPTDWHLRDRLTELTR